MHSPWVADHRHKLLAQQRGDVCAQTRRASPFWCLHPDQMPFLVALSSQQAYGWKKAIIPFPDRELYLELTLPTLDLLHLLRLLECRPCWRHLHFLLVVKQIGNRQNLNLGIIFGLSRASDRILPIPPPSTSPPSLVPK